MKPTYIEHSHPEFATEQASQLEAELVRLARAIEHHRKSIRPVPSIRAWVKQYPGLGSDKTWRKILNEDFDGLSVEAQVPNYRGVLAALDAKVRERSTDELYSDLPPAEAVSLAALRLMHHHGKDRLILIEGGSGSSKTSSLQILSQNEAAGGMVVVEASEVWRSPRAAMHDILSALGCSEEKMPNSTAGMLYEIQNILNRKGRIILAIDEAHHSTGAVLNIFKTLLNKTEVLLILAGMKTLFQKLRAVSCEETKQLIHNRLFAKIELTGPDQDGARKFLMRRLGVNSAFWKASTLKDLIDRSANSGHWAFMRRVVDHIHDGGLSADDVDDATLLTAAQNAQLEIA